MPEESPPDTGDYSPVQNGEKSTNYYTKTDIDIDTEKRMGEKYIALQAEEEKTWWDNQTNRTVIAVLISIVFIGVIAALVFLLPCTVEDEYENTTPGSDVTFFTELIYEEKSLATY